MTHASPTPDGLGPAAPPPSEAATWLQSRMDGPGRERLARYLKRARFWAQIVTILVLILGVIGLVLGLFAWRSTTFGLMLVVLLSIPGVVGPLLLWRRVGALTRAVTHPDQVVAQARDLASQLRSSPELDDLTRRLGGLHRDSSSTPEVGPEVGRVRKAIRVARLGSQVVGQAQPDRSRHPLLIAFTPERLGSLWRWLTVTLWGAPLSALLAFAALVTLLVRQI